MYCIAGMVADKFGVPIISIRLGQAGVFTSGVEVLVPETAVNEDDSTAARKNHIWLTCKASGKDTPSGRTRCADALRARGQHGVGLQSKQVEQGGKFRPLRMLAEA